MRTKEEWERLLKDEVGWSGMDFFLKFTENVERIQRDAWAAACEAQIEKCIHGELTRAPQYQRAPFPGDPT